MMNFESFILNPLKKFPIATVIFWCLEPKIIMNAMGCCLLGALEVQERESSRKSRKHMNNRGKRLIFHFHGFKNFLYQFCVFWNFSPS